MGAVWGPNTVLGSMLQTLGRRPAAWKLLLSVKMRGGGGLGMVPASQGDGGEQTDDYQNQPVWLASFLRLGLSCALGICGPPAGREKANAPPCLAITCVLLER